MANAMTLDFPTAPPEWRRSGHFFAIAIGLHLAVLAIPLGKALSELPPPPLSVRLVEAIRPPQPVPLEAPKPVAQPAVTKATPAQRTPQPKLTPVLAVTPAQQPITASTPTVAPPAPVAETPAPVAKVAAAPVTTVTAARFDAAYLQNPKPAYPPLSRRLGEEGKVLLKVRVTTEGHPAAVDLEKSSNFERLDEAARQAVARWRFVPARRGDEAVEASVIVPVVFRLDS